MIKKLPAFLEL